MKISRTSILNLFSFILISTVLTSCTVEKDISLDDIVNEISIEDDDRLVEGKASDLRRIIGINPNEVDEFIYYKPKSTMDVSEVLLIKVKDESQKESLQELLEKHIESQTEKFKSYSPKNCALLEDYKIKNIGGYIMYAVSENVEEVSDDFVKLFKK